MRDVNKVILIGRLGQDPTQRETKKGNPVTSFSLATSRKVSPETAKMRGLATEEETQWHNIVAWGKQGEICAKYLKKGASVYIEGAIRSRKYNGSDGTQKTSFEVHAENISMLNTRRMPESSEGEALEASA